MFTFRYPDRVVKHFVNPLPHNLVWVWVVNPRPDPDQVVKHFVNKISTSENVVVEMPTNPDERIPSFIFKQIDFNVGNLYF